MNPSLRRIYLDNAATSWPKPDSVYAAVDNYQRHVGAPAGRSPYAEAVEVTSQVERVRTACARLLGAAAPKHLMFTASGTDALNMAIHGLLRAGDRVVTSAAEHNSVLRPLAELAARGLVTVDRARCDALGIVDPDDLRTALAPQTRLVVLTHASNVTGTVQPIDDLIAVAHDAGAKVLIDGAQTAGHLPIDVARLGIDLLATSGHKGLLGPLGTGLLYIRPGLEADFAPLRQGGTGTHSEQDRQPEDLPDKYESGNLNVPGILGLGAGIDYLLGAGIEQLQQRLVAHAARLVAGLRSISGVRVLAATHSAPSLGLVSFVIDGYDPQEVAAALDATFRIQVRPGLHCAPHMHRLLGTLERGGTVRVSSGVFTTADEVEQVVAAVRDMTAVV